MKKKTMVFLTVMLLAILAFYPGCKKSPAAKELALVPADASLVLTFDFQKFSQLELFDKMISSKKVPKAEGEKEIFKDYQDFKDKTGIDAKKDVFFVTAALYGDFEKPEGVGIVQLNYDQAKILTLLEKNQVQLIKENYGGMIVYKVEEKKELETAETKKEEMTFVFLNKNHIAFGTPNRIKTVIDLVQGKGQDIMASKNFKKYFGKTKDGAMLRLVMAQIPQKIKSMPPPGTPFAMDMSKTEAFIGFVDYASKTLSGELQMISPNEPVNKQIAEAINGVKAIFALGSSDAQAQKKNAELAELLNSINVTAAADHVKLTFSLTETLMNKLGEKVKSEAEQMMTPPVFEQETQENVQEPN